MLQRVYGFGVIVWVLLLFACEHTAPISSAPSQAEPQAPLKAEPQPRTQAQTIAHLLARAERALARDRLLSPVNGNAYDYYASVLWMAPSNQAAKLGMQAIVLRYIDLARSAAQESHFQAANQYFDHALSINPNDPNVQALVKDLREQTQSAQKKSSVSENAVILNASLLSKRSADIMEQLSLLAQSVKRDNNAIVIVARNDAEGRWIYQQMREAVPGYLLRGDIQVGSPARIELQPPIE